MKKVFLSLSIALFVLAACQSQPKPDEVVLAATKPWTSGNVDESRVETSLAYFADDAVFKMVGMPPGQPDTFTGKEAIREAYTSWLPLHPKLQVEIQQVEGDTVTARTLYWSDMMVALGVAPLEGTDVYTIKDGKIKSETWTLTEASQTKLMAAIAAAQATPTPLPPTATPAPPTATSAPPSATFVPEVLASKPEDVMGLWQGRYQGETILIEFKEGGYNRVKWPDSKYLIAEGTYRFEEAQLKWEITSGDCFGVPTASYEVYVTKQEDKPIRLWLVRINDACENRVTTLREAPLVPHAP